MNSFTAQDVAGSAVACLAFATVLYVPGFVVGYATDLFGFRRMGRLEQGLWALLLSFGVVPIGVYFGGRVAGLEAVCWALVALTAIFLLVGLKAGWREFAGWGRREGLLAAVLVGWFLLVAFSLVDLQVGRRLYFSVIEFDQSYRVAFTDAVLRSGLPPANPLYFGGGPAPMRYYYFWYAVCALVAKIGHVTSRQAFIASSFWAGLGLAAAIGLYVRYFLGAVAETSRQTWICLGLLAVTGADCCRQ